MNPNALLKGPIVTLAVFGFCLPQPLLAAGRAESKPIIADVQLHRDFEGNVLVGQVVDPYGSAKANVPVVLEGGDQGRLLDTTDGNGRFAFRGLHGGLYRVAAAGGHGSYRVWAPGTAPPSAQRGILVVAEDNTVRGQSGGFAGRMKRWLANPWVIGGIVAVAVAVPVALHNANRDEDEGPMSP